PAGRALSWRDPRLRDDVLRRSVTKSLGQRSFGRLTFAQLQAQGAPFMLRVTLLAAGLAGLSSTAFAEGHAIGLKAGGLGLGLEYTYELSDRFALRGGINGSEIGVDSEESGIRYDFDVVWDSLSVGV